MSRTWRQRLSRSFRTPGRFWYAGFVGFLVLTLVGHVAFDSDGTSAAAAPAAMQPVAVSPDESYTAAPYRPPSIDDAIQLIETARDSFRDVHTYSCRMVQRERVGDKLPPETVLAMQVRTQPFSVHLKWLEPRSMVGQEAIYVAGRNAGKMRVRGAGLLGAVGFLTLDLNDARARRASRHNISEAGLGNLIERFAEGWPRERSHGGVEVHIDDFSFAGRSCTRVETIHAANGDGFFLFGRSVVYFDNITHLPARVENYDWPKRPGEAANLLEEYSYLDLRLNPVLSDDVFDQ
jgi:uncharacterized protein DUF1571